MKKVIFVLLLGFFSNSIGMQKSYLAYLPKELNRELNHFVGYNKIKEALESSRTYNEALNRIKELAKIGQFSPLFNDADFAQFLIKELGKQKEAPAFRLYLEVLKGIAQALDTPGAQQWLKRIDLIEAFMNATREGELEAVRDFLGQGIDVNTQDIYGDTTIMIAAYKGHKKIVELLINAGADVNVKASLGYTALINAADGGHKEIIALLLRAGADVNAQAKDGWTAIMKAMRYAHKSIVELLKEHGAKE